jgi:hypothetical protein
LENEYADVCLAIKELVGWNPPAPSLKRMLPELVVSKQKLNETVTKLKL